MSDSKLSITHCAVLGCKTSVINKSLGVTFYSFPGTSNMRKKWLGALKNRCPSLIWHKSKICSKHFDNRLFDSGKKLKENAVPTIFPSISSETTQNTKVVDTPSIPSQKTKLDRLLNKKTQSELLDDIKGTMKLIKVPGNFSDCVDDDLQCIPDTPVEAQLWLLIKKQDHLITRLMQLLSQNKKHVEVLQNSLEESRASKKNMEQNVETSKYVVKCLQEKLATLEEQVEILTAVESR